MPIESYPKELINKYFHGSKNDLETYFVDTATNTINKKKQERISIALWFRNNASEIQEQKGCLLGMLLVTLGDNLLGGVPAGKGDIGAGEKVIRAGENF